MPMTSASSPVTLRKMMRRLRLENVTRTNRYQPCANSAASRRHAFLSVDSLASRRCGSTSVVKLSGVRLSTVIGLAVARPHSRRRRRPCLGRSQGFRRRVLSRLVLRRLRSSPSCSQAPSSGSIRRSTTADEGNRESLQQVNGHGVAHLQSRLICRRASLDISYVNAALAFFSRELAQRGISRRKK